MSFSVLRTFNIIGYYRAVDDECRILFLWRFGLLANRQSKFQRVSSTNKLMAEQLTPSSILSAQENGLRLDWCMAVGKYLGSSLNLVRVVFLFHSYGWLDHHITSGAGNVGLLLMLAFYLMIAMVVSFSG